MSDENTYYVDEIRIISSDMGVEWGNLGGAKVNISEFIKTKRTLYDKQGKMYVVGGNIYDQAIALMSTEEQRGFLHFLIGYSKGHGILPGAVKGFLKYQRSDDVLADTR